MKDNDQEEENDKKDEKCTEQEKEQEGFDEQGQKKEETNVKQRMGIEGTGWIRRKGKGVGGERESKEVKEGKGGR